MHKKTSPDSIENIIPDTPSTKSSSRTILISTLLGLSLNACEPAVTPLYGVEMVDEDNDGQFQGDDCNDQDPFTYYGAAESEYVEENTAAECMTDADEDGWGDAFPNEDYPISAGLDCDDSNPDIHPEAEEIPNDGIDQNCNDSDLD